jgi:hypothetical protein
VAIAATKSKILAWKNDQYPRGFPRAAFDAIHNPKAVAILQITATTRQTIPSQ